MEQVLEKIRDAVGAYKPEPEPERYESVRLLLAAFDECQQYVKENARTDRGCAQRMSREMDELLKSLPIFRSLTGGTNVHQLHTRKLAEEYLDGIGERLKDILKEEQEDKKRQIHQWVHKHPVLGELKRVTSKHLPKTAYILLFQQLEDGTFKLVTQEAESDKVYTRLRPHEFKNGLKLYETYHDELPIVGAAVISEEELLLVIGKVPEPVEGKDQLQTLLSISSQAAGKPAKDFIETNEVLKELHEMSRRRKNLKDAYILLFQRGEEAEAEAPELVWRKANDGKVISRFWASDFAIRHKVFDTFRGKPDVVGAAVIKEKELTQVMGAIPQPKEDETQLDVLLNLSRSAVEKPFLDFIQANEVLKGLHECANSEIARQDPEVILFELTSAGRIDVMPLPDQKGKPRRRTPLSEFQYAKVTHDKFARGTMPVGASVLTKAKSKPHGDNRRPAPSSKSKVGAPQRHAPAQEERAIVLAAFGRTPLRTNLIATPENMRRLGVNL